MWQAKAKLDCPTTPIVDPYSSTSRVSFPPTQSPLIPPSKHHAPPPLTTLHLPHEFHHSWNYTHSDDFTVNTPDLDIVVPEDTPPLLPPPPDIVPPPPQPTQTTRLGRAIRAPLKFSDTAHSTLLAYTATFTPSVQDSEEHILQPTTADYSEPRPLALLGSHIFSFVVTDPDTMTLKEVLSQPDREKFLVTIRKEFNDHVTRKH